jgi:hypothetical protein
LPPSSSNRVARNVPSVRRHARQRLLRPAALGIGSKPGDPSKLGLARPPRQGAIAPDLTGADDDEHFEFGLNVLIAGLEAVSAAENAASVPRATPSSTSAPNNGMNAPSMP